MVLASLEISGTRNSAALTTAQTAATRNHTIPPPFSRCQETGQLPTEYQVKAGLDSKDRPPEVESGGR